MVNLGTARRRNSPIKTARPGSLTRDIKYYIGPQTYDIRYVVRHGVQPDIIKDTVIGLGWKIMY